MMEWRRRWLEGVYQRRWLFLVLAIALVLDVLFFTGYYAYDDHDYTWAAHKISHFENFMQPRSTNYELAAVRLAFNFPLAVVYWLSDGSVSWMSGFQMVYHLGCVIVAYALGRAVSGERAGRLAAVIAATCPLFYNFAGTMLPDVALAMWSGLHLLLLIKAIERAKHPEQSGWRSSRLFFVAGLVLGIAYSVKATAIVLSFPAAIAIIAAFPSIRSPRWIVHGAWLAAGLLVVMLLEFALLSSLTGEPMSQLVVAHDSTNWDFPMWAQKQGLHPWVRLKYATNGLREHMPITFVAFAAGAIAHSATRRRNVTVIAFLWFSFIFLTVGSASLTHYLPQPLFPRYFTLIILPASVALACAVVEGLERYAAWKARPRKASLRLVVTALVGFGVFTAIYEVDYNLKFSNILGFRGWSNSFVLAYERAQREYPEYPIVLSEQAAGVLIPVLLPDIPQHVHWHTTEVPWAEDGKPMPRPPFIFLDWMRPTGKPGIARIPGIDASRVTVETLAIVRPGAGPGLDRMRAAAHTLFGAEANDSFDETSLWDATTIQLVTSSTESKPASHLPPLVEVLDHANVDLHLDPSGAVALRWGAPGRFGVSYFDGPDPKIGPESPLAHVEPARQITVTLGARTFREPVTGSIEVLAFDQGAAVVGEETQHVVIPSGVPQRYSVTVTGNEPIHAFRVIWWINGHTSGAVHLDPIAVSSVPVPIGERPTPAIVSLEEDQQIRIDHQGERAVVRWTTDHRLVLQYFDARNFRRMPSNELAAIDPPATSFAVTGSVKVVDGPPITAEVEVFAYGEDRELAGRGVEKVKLGATTTSFTVKVPATRPAHAFRVRWWLDATAPAAIELGPLGLTRNP